jgi:phosphatidylinositol 4-kinase
MISMSNRQSYTSTVSAMLSMCDSKEVVLRRFCSDLDAAAAQVRTLDKAQATIEAEGGGQPDQEILKFGGRVSVANHPRTYATKSFHETVWKITASLILLKPGNDEKLIFALTRAPLKMFNAATMKVVVECWNWLLSARPDMEMKFLQEMISSWHSSQTAGLGIFHIDDEGHSPLAPDEEMKAHIKPRNPDNEPHDVWIRFVQERIEVAKYCSQEQIIMFTHMLQRTLDISVGREKASMSRHAAAAGTRFRLLNCGMSLLQGDVLPKSMAKNTLRQRIYSAAMDYFCAEKTYPTQTGTAMTEDVQIMLKFWTTMHQDRKHIKTSAIGDLEGLANLTTSDAVSHTMGPGAAGMSAMSQTGNALDTRSISSEFHKTPSIAGGWGVSGSTGNNTMSKR